jgi:transcriptional regulator GlxA family with amidase domain
MDFLEEVRLTRARELLGSTELSIQRIASEVGFRDPHYFGRVFRQRVGKSPRNYRIHYQFEVLNHRKNPD